MRKVIIIGGGFAGLTAAAKLSRSQIFKERILIDKKLTSDFLPTLPDCLGRAIAPCCLSYAIKNFCKKTRFTFINEEVNRVDLQKKEVFTQSKTFKYDYLLITSGSETNFYGNENIKNNSLKLDDSADAQKLVSALKENSYANYIIAGAGYTGVEVATNLRLFLKKAARRGKIIIVERSSAILGPLPSGMKDYAANNLRRLKITVFTDNSISKINGRTVYLSDGKVFDDTLVVWAAGVKTSAFILGLTVEKNPQGRIKVDDYLRLDGGCFVAGDASYFSHRGNFLRMAV